VPRRSGAGLVSEVGLDIGHALRAAMATETAS
jgi:hypothetical protein